jgi:hypothetical protein
LPGEHRPPPTHPVGGYKITVERADGVACEKEEALTALGMYCFQACSEGWRMAPTQLDEKPNAATLAALAELENGGGEVITLEQLRAEMQALQEEAD